MKNILGTKKNLELFDNGKLVYQFVTNSSGYSSEYTRDEKGNILTYKDSDGVSYEYTRDEKGNILTYKDSDGYSSEYTYNEKGNELTYKNSDGDYRIKNKPATKEEYESFIQSLEKPKQQTAMQELQKLLINKIIKKENGRLNDLQEGFNNGLRFTLEHIEDLFEKEKEQIIKTSKESYEYALLKRGLPIYRDEPNLESETYSENYYNRNYNQTYNQNK